MHPSLSRTLRVLLLLNSLSLDNEQTCDIRCSLYKSKKEKEKEKFNNTLKITKCM